MQIVIVCSNQCVAEIPRVFTERIVIDTEPKGFHILNHKHGGGSCVSLAERVNLPNIRCEFCKVLHRCFNRQSLIGELFFGGKIIIQRVLYAVEISINNRFAVQYPFLFGNVILTDLSCVIKYAFKQSAVNGNPLSRRKLKRLFTQKLRYSCRYDICLFCFVFGFCTGGSLLVIAVNTLLSFINGNFTLDVHVDYVDENASQSINSKVPKYQFDTLDCTLEELAVLELVAKNPTIKQQELVEATGKSIATIKRIMKSLQDKNYIRRESGKRYGKWEVLV